MHGTAWSSCRGSQTSAERRQLEKRPRGQGALNTAMRTWFMLQWVASKRTASDCTTCLATCGSGAGTATAKITVWHLQPAMGCEMPPRATAWTVAAASAFRLRARGWRSATATRRRTAPAAWVSAPREASLKSDFSPSPDLRAQYITQSRRLASRQDLREAGSLTARASHPQPTRIGIIPLIFGLAGTEWRAHGKLHK